MKLRRHPDPRRFAAVVHQHELDDNAWAGQVLSELRYALPLSDRASSCLQKMRGLDIVQMGHMQAHSRWGAFLEGFRHFPFPQRLYDLARARVSFLSMHEHGVTIPREACPPGPVRDWFGVHVLEGGVGLYAGVFLEAPERISSAAHRWWSPLLAHTRAVLRLRQAAARGDAEVAAVLAPGGGVSHVGGGLGGGALSGIRAAVVARESARLARRAIEPSQLWPALVHGRYTLADRFEADGRRWVVAYRNDAESRAVALTSREQQIASMVGCGETTKEIASELGVLPSTVSSLLTRIASKLGVGSVPELVDLYSALRDSAADAEVAFDMAILSAPAPAISDGVTPAERATLRLVLAGKSNREIASERGVSARTVANQVASLLRKLGAPSRSRLGMGSAKREPVTTKSR